MLELLIETINHSMLQHFYGLCALNHQHAKKSIEIINDINVHFTHQVLLPNIVIDTITNWRPWGVKPASSVIIRLFVCIIFAVHKEP